MKVFSAAQDTLGFWKRKCQDWFAESCEEIDALLETKRNLFRKTLSTNLSNQAKIEGTKTYKDFQKVAQTRMREIQNQWWPKKAEEAQIAANSKNSGLFYQIMKELYGPQQSIFVPLKSKDGATLRQPEDIKKRWCEHYSELFNRHPVVDESVLDIIKQHDPIMALDEVPSRGEIKASVSQMNNNKTPGMDGIKTEILKNGGEKMIDLLEQVIQSVQESEVPQDWRDAIPVSLYKKGVKSDCNNFRGISLLSIVGKLFSRIILNRLVHTVVNGILPESQCGFRASRGTVDRIFSPRQLHEK